MKMKSKYLLPMFLFFITGYLSAQEQEDDKKEIKLEVKAPEEVLLGFPCRLYGDQCRKYRFRLSAEDERVRNPIRAYVVELGIDTGHRRQNHINKSPDLYIYTDASRKREI